jgi:ubiquinone/menaquinone biosynthesis C-methylase UbiE
MAREYDAAFTHTAVGRALREIVWSHLDGRLRASQRVLELGCGTGEDALHLARAGIRVTATDVSAAMLEVAQRKACRHAGVAPIEFRRLPMEAVAGSFESGSFDAVFSNFGALNCVGDLRSLARDLARVLVPGAPLIWVIMGRRAPWEWIWYLPRGEVRRAMRRFRRDGVEWRGARISYPTPAEVRAALAPCFAVRRLSPLGCVLPPSYASAWLNRSPRILNALTRLELRAQHSPALAGWSDHYIVEAERLPDVTHSSAGRCARVA